MFVPNSCSVIPLRRCRVAVVVRHRETGCFCAGRAVADDDEVVDDDVVVDDDDGYDDSEVGAALPTIIVIFASW